MKLPLREIVGWDVTNWSRALSVWEAGVGTDLSGAFALELGSRNGGLALWLALRGATVVCSDLEEPGDDARDLHRQFGVHSRISYAAVDATTIGRKSEFDIIAFKSVLGGIGSLGRKERQRVALLSIHQSLKPGGTLVFAENLPASPAHRVLRKVAVPWGRAWRYASLDELREFLAPFAGVDLRSLGFLGALGRSERQRRVLGALDRVIDPAVPATWRYVAVGVATKDRSSSRLPDLAGHPAGSAGA